MTEIRYERQDIPASLLACRVEPGAPAADGSDEAAANYVIDLAIAGRDCRAKLDAVRGLVNQAGKR